MCLSVLFSLLTASSELAGLIASLPCIITSSGCCSGKPLPEYLLRGIRPLLELCPHWTHLMTSVHPVVLLGSSPSLKLQRTASSGNDIDAIHRKASKGRFPTFSRGPGLSGQTLPESRVGLWETLGTLTLVRPLCCLHTQATSQQALSNVSMCLCALEQLSQREGCTNSWVARPEKRASFLLPSKGITEFCNEKDAACTVSLH